MVGAVLGGALGFLGSMGSQVLVHIFTSRRDLAQAELEEARGFWDKYGQAYFDFQGGWKGAHNATLLTTEFDRLRAAAWVPSDIEVAYHAAHDAFLDGAATEGSKIQARAALQQSLDQFLSRFAPITPRRPSWFARLRGLRG
jgi:hypothetical protein